MLRFPAGGPPVHTEVGQRRGGLLDLLGAAGAGAYGPYVALPRGRYVARLRFRAGWAPGGAAALDVSADNGETRIASRPFDGARLPEAGMAVELLFEAASDLAGVEVRLICRPGFTGTLEAVEITPSSAALSRGAAPPLHGLRVSAQTAFILVCQPPPNSATKVESDGADCLDAQRREHPALHEGPARTSCPRRSRP